MCGCTDSQSADKGKEKNVLNVKKEIKKENAEEQALEAKIVLLGDSGVGKSSIALRFCKNEFSEAHEVTIGSAYIQQTITLSSGKILKLHIWDTGGSEKFRALIPLYYRDANAAILTYDISREKSFDAVQYWLNEISTKADISKMVLALAGNKCDIPPDDRKISHAKGKQFGDENSMVFKETSAKTNQGISELFKEIAIKIYEKKYGKI